LYENDSVVELLYVALILLPVCTR